MTKKMLIDATHPEETRVVVVDGTQVEEFDFETANRRQLAGNIYLAKVTRVEPSLQAAFVEYGGNRHGFLAFAEIHPDYYQIPAADRKALLEEERAAADAADAEDDARQHRADKRRRAQPAAGNGDAVTASDAIPGMEVQDDDDSAEDDVTEASSDHGDDHGDEAIGDVERQVENASDRDSSIESVADEAITAEVPVQRKQMRARRYKIQEVVKVRQIMLVQVVKEERGNKGAALTTYLSLAGRYCVLMPNTGRGGGISRKITNVADRKKLKEIAGELEVPQGAGLIIRTAGSQRTRTEIRRDYEYLMRLWEQIRELTFRSTAPAPIYEEGDLIKRSIRDLYSKEIDEVLVEGERGYRTAHYFMAMIMPSHAQNVKNYTDPMPLLARYQVESYLSGMFNPVVQLKSGGYIVIGITEALVAIDVNSGRATKEGSIEDTAYKTNCEAADEITRQLRLRDLAGLIVIDFIDMDERRNNANVEKRFKDKLKTDRARIQVGRISGFGLMEMSRQRLRPGMLESTTQPCPHCHGTGLIRSDDSLALTILRAIEEEGTRKRSREVLVKAPVPVANYLINDKREHIATMEGRFGMSVRVEADPALISPDYVLEKFKTATRVVPEVSSAALSVSADLMAEIDEHSNDNVHSDEEDIAATISEASAEDTGEDVSVGENGTGSGDEGTNGDSRGSRRRRRRRRPQGGNGNDAQDEDLHASGNGKSDKGDDDDDSDNASDDGRDDVTARPVATEAPILASENAAPSATPEAAEIPAKGNETPEAERTDVPAIPVGVEAPVIASEDVAPATAPEAAEAPARPSRSRHIPTPEMEPVSTEATAMPEVAPAVADDAALGATAEQQDTAPAVAGDEDGARPVADTGEAASAGEGDTVTANEAAAPPAKAEQPKRKGWWSFGA